jgi:hypothetical protein
MAAEICSRFSGYPSTYIRNHTLIDLIYDYKCFLLLVESEKKAYNENK